MSLQPGDIGDGMSEGVVERKAPARPATLLEHRVDDHGDVLYRDASVGACKPEIAQDLVQETLLAAMRGYEKLVRQSCVRSWLRGILKHKLGGHFRSAGSPVQ